MLYFAKLPLKIIYLISIGLIVLACTQPTRAQTITSIPKDSTDELTDTTQSKTRLEISDTMMVKHPQLRVDSLIQYAYSFMGKRYRRGGTTSKGFDCSGYTMTVYKKFNIKLPHTSAGQGLMGIEINRAQISKGDLILFRGRSRRGKRIGHVGIVISEKGQPVRFIHSSTSEGVRIDRLEYLYYKKRYIKSVRLPELSK